MITFKYDKQRINRYTKFMLNGYKWRILYTSDISVVNSAMFDLEKKEIIIFRGYIKSSEMLLETIRHEIFEACMATIGCRFISIDVDNGPIMIILHKNIDPLLGMYHQALETLE